MDTSESISLVLSRSLCGSQGIYDAYVERLGNGLPTRDENARSHFCAYFLPFNMESRRVFVVHHKKSGLWLSPGGHIDSGETLLQAVNREIGEELGVKNFFKGEARPFLLTITRIENVMLSCKEHYDVWFLLLTAATSTSIVLNSTRYGGSRLMRREKLLAIQQTSRR